MRILVDRRRNDRGAVAILSVILCMFLIGLAAFTVDFGTAYVSKRQLQTAADAGALAAASVYAQADGSCAQLVDPSGVNYPTNLAAAQKAADDIRVTNRPDSAGTSIQPKCNTNGQLYVDYSASGTTSTTFAGLLGFNSLLASHRDSQATVVVPPDATGARPYAICSKDLTSGAVPSPVMKVSFPGTGGTPTDCGTLSGDWWTLQCPGEPKDLAGQTASGCKNPIKIVPGQADHDDTPADLSNYLLTSNPGCGGGFSNTCLKADTGNNFTQQDILNAWNQVLLGKTIVLPVFCGGTSCDPDALSGSGTNGKYPIYALVGVTICGFHFNKDNGNKQGSPANQVTTGACSNNPNGYDAVADTSNSASYLLVVFTHIQTSGSTQPSDCGQGGGACDNGLRNVQLTR